MKKQLPQTKKYIIKRIRTKLERFKNDKGVKLKIICNIIDYLERKKNRANPINLLNLV
jgi:hypothetical protein